MTLVAARGRGVPRLARFLKNRSGNIAILFALVASTLMVAIGGAIDFGRWLHARDQTVNAIDAALLAGGRSLQTNNMDVAAAIATAQAFYATNVADRVPVMDDTINFAVTDNGKAITASGNAYLRTTFLQLANIGKLALITTATSEFSKAELASGGKGGENLEISLMLDVTGSMGGQRLKDLKDAATDLINIVVWEDQSKFTSKAALVPFSEDIRLPTTAALNKARGTNLAKSKTITTGSGWWKTTENYYLSDCVVERTGSQKYTDAAPANNRYVMAHYTSNSTGHGSKQEGVCTIPQGAEVMPLSSDKYALISKIDGLSAFGGTAGQLGTAWAWYTLSPNWASLWSSDARPQAYGTENLRKIAILMTDGEYNTQYDSDGISASESSAANGSSTSQARDLCTAMKAKGTDIEIYTVLFDQKNQSVINLMKNCATKKDNEEYFYTADNGDQLKQAFRDIAIKLSTLYLSK